MIERSITIGPYTHTVHDLHPRDGIRWAVGSIDGKRSSTWRLWDDKKGDVYLAMRSLGGKVKVSIHRDRRCSIGFTKEFEAEAMQRFGTPSRHWGRWILPDAPVVKAIQVLIPDSELVSFPASESDPMAWIPPPGERRAVVFTVFVAEPPNEFTWENPEKDGNLLGTMICSTRSTWLVHSNQPLDEATCKFIEDGRKKSAQLAKPHLATAPPEGLRMAIWGMQGEAKSEVFLIETDASKLALYGKQCRLTIQ